MLYAVKNDKGEWLGWEAYQDDPEFICGGGSVWTDLDKAKFYAKANGGRVVELVEKPEPVVVSEAEAEMLEQTKNMLNPMHVLWMNELTHNGDSDGQDRLMRAYVNGWVVEEPKRWYVKVPHATNSYYYDMGWGNGLETKNMKAGTQPLPGFREAQFTQDEINKRGLQSFERVEVTDDEQ